MEPLIYFYFVCIKDTFSRLEENVPMPVPVMTMPKIVYLHCQQNHKAVITVHNDLLSLKLRVGSKASVDKER